MKFYGKEETEANRKDETRPQIQIWDDPLLDSILSFARDTRKLITIEIHVTYRGGCIIPAASCHRRKKRKKGRKNRQVVQRRKKRINFGQAWINRDCLTGSDRSLKHEGSNPFLKSIFKKWRVSLARSEKFLNAVHDANDARLHSEKYPRSLPRVVA